MRKGPTLTLGSRLCQCSVCGIGLASPSAFDLHRQGGKCLTQAALRRAGWVKNRHGFWTVPRERGARDGSVPR